MNEKPAFREIEQRTTPQGARSNLRFDPMANTAVYGQIGQAVGKMGDLLIKMQERNDKLAMGAWEQKLADDERTLKLRLENTNSPEEVDAIYREYEQNTLSQAKERLGNRLYDKWKREAGDTYLEVTRQMSERAKFPIMQRKGIVDLEENLRQAARNRSLADTEEERVIADNLAMLSIQYAAYPQDGSPALINDTKRAELVQAYRNQADVYDVEASARTNAAGTLKQLADGHYKYLTPEQITSLTQKIKPLVDEQERTNLYNGVIEQSETNLQGAIKQLHENAQKSGAKPQNEKAAADMVYATYNRNIQAKRLVREEAEAQVLDNSYKHYLAGDTNAAIQTVLTSTIPNDKKQAIIKNMKQGRISEMQHDNPETYNGLMRGIMDGTIYNNNPILEALAAGQIKETSKDALIQTLTQRQKPSYELLQEAIKQVDKVYNKGLMGGLTPAESMALSNIHRELNDMFLSAVQQNRDLESMRALFAPENVQRVADKYAVGVNDNVQSYIDRIQPKKQAEGAGVPQRLDGETVEAYLQRVGGNL